ncbi:uncharacterized protein N7529_003539 [Penicillium soppii]|jgi:hypothetical protein|uniref:uncharacterized protein n=1 Tax=Penicillium soppii TaxID=69789 RepID=UPI00254807FD|nr:uncharacterized protein N7529_003539 [Penicillium soppii]KAJ5871186.1 hypothetical protein N7529_003539 [Penicillium soppii]
MAAAIDLRMGYTPWLGMMELIDELIKMPTLNSHIVNRREEIDYIGPPGTFIMAHYHSITVKSLNFIKQTSLMMRSLPRQ